MVEGSVLILVMIVICDNHADINCLDSCNSYDNKDTDHDNEDDYDEVIGNEDNSFDDDNDVDFNDDTDARDVDDQVNNISYCDFSFLLTSILFLIQI